MKIMNVKEKIQEMLSLTEKPSKFMLDYIKIGNEHKEIMLDKYIWSIAQIEHTLELTNSLIDRINYISKEEFHKDKIIQWFLFKEMLDFLFSAFNELLNWRYAQSMTLIRVSVESLMSISWISFNKDNPEGVFKDKTSVKQFNMSRFLKEYWFDIDLWYKLLSWNAHASSYSVLCAWDNLKEWQKEPIWVLYNSINSRELQICINYIQLIQLCFIKLCISTLLKEDKILNKSLPIYNNVDTTIFALREIIISIKKNNIENSNFNMLEEFEWLLLKLD